MANFSQVQNISCQKLQISIYRVTRRQNKYTCTISIANATSVKHYLNLHNLFVNRRGKILHEKLMRCKILQRKKLILSRNQAKLIEITATVNIKNGEKWSKLSIFYYYTENCCQPALIKNTHGFISYLLSFLLGTFGLKPILQVTQGIMCRKLAPYVHTATNQTTLINPGFAVLRIIFRRRGLN